MVTQSPSATRLDWQAAVAELAPIFAARAAAHDADDTFVAENYRLLKDHKLFSAGVPLELGGGGLSHAELCAMLRELAHACGSTALALSMHTHLLGVMVWNYGRGQPVAPTLKRIANEQLVMVSTGASDWLTSGGTAERVDGGFRVSGRKIFGSGSPAGDLLMTTARYDDPADGATVLHFSVPMHQPGVTVLDNWRVLGMRASGSNDVLLEGVFVPETSVSLRRPRDKWHPLYNAILTVASPLILSVYLGVAESARDLAIEKARRKREDQDVWSLVGEMENLLETARLAVDSAIALCANYAFAPDNTTGNAAAIRKTIASEALLACVEKALQVVGGGGLFRSVGLERLLREMHGVQFHPLQIKRQQRFTGRYALGLEPVD
jgi:alkylation response protein AidB-like acyl-CoA dehydrogenase